MYHIPDERVGIVWYNMEFLLEEPITSVDTSVQAACYAVDFQAARSFAVALPLR